MNVVDIITDDDIRLAEHAEAIRVLSKRVVADVIEIGERLTDAKERCGHGNWGAWLDREFGWGEVTAWNFIKVCEASRKYSNFEDLNVPISALYLLAAPKTPIEVIDAVAERSEQGERVSLDEVKQMIADAGQQAEKRIAKLVAEHDAEVAALREAAKAEQGLTPDEIEALIDKAVAPLKERIKKYKERLNRKPKKTIPDPHGLASMRLQMGMEGLVEVMTMITPEQKIESQRVTTTITGQSMLDGLADTIKNARLIVAWLEKFLGEAEKLQ